MPKIDHKRRKDHKYVAYADNFFLPFNLLAANKMAELFQRDRSVIGKHVRNIFKEGELQKESVWAKFAYTAADGKVYDVDYYNLDVIISVGYRVKSKRGTQFRIWATGILAVLRYLP